MIDQIHYLVVESADHFCHAEFSTCCIIHNKIDHSSECQPDEFQDELIVKNNEKCSYSKQIKLMGSQAKIKCHKVKRILRYYGPNKILYKKVS